MVPTRIPIRVAQPTSIRWIGIWIESQPGLGARVNTASDREGMGRSAGFNEKGPQYYRGSSDIRILYQVVLIP